MDLAAIRRLGFVVKYDPVTDRIHLSPSLTDELRAEVIKSKPRIIEQLKAESGNGAPVIKIKSPNLTKKGGVGTELRAIIPKFFERSGCGCKSYAKDLDRNGLQWCVEHKSDIIEHLVSKATETFLGSLSETLDRFVATRWVDQAIKEATKKDYANLIGDKPTVTIDAAELMRVDPFTPKHPRAIVTVIVGDRARQLAEFTLPAMQAYADRCNADLHVISDDRSPEYTLANKFRTAIYAAEYDRTLFVDADAFIRPTCPNLFERLPGGSYYAHADLPHNSKLQAMIRYEIKAVAGVPVDDAMMGRVRLRNSGVVLMDRDHAPAWTPPIHPLVTTHCAEQSWIEYQLLSSGVRCSDLPVEFNTQWWFRDFGKRLPAAQIVHLAACPHDERLRILRSLAAGKL